MRNNCWQKASLEHEYLKANYNFELRIGFIFPKIQTRALLCIFKPIPSQSSLLSFSFYFQGQHVCCPGLVIFGLEGQHHTLWYFPSNDVKDWLVANWVYVKGLLLQFKMRLRNRTALRSINAFFRVALW